MFFIKTAKDNANALTVQMTDRQLYSKVQPYCGICDSIQYMGL